MSWPEDVLYSESDEYLKGFFGSWNRYFRKLLGKKEKKKKKDKEQQGSPAMRERCAMLVQKCTCFGLGAASHGECVNRPGKKN